MTTVAAVAAVIGAGTVAQPAAAYSPYDPGTQSSLNNLVTAMESYALFDGGDSYEGVTATALSDWGWSRPSTVNVAITIEGDGDSWRAVAQDIHSGASEYTYSSTYPVNGVGAGSVQASAPQPDISPTVASLTITDVGEAIDLDGLGSALVAGGVSLQEVCDFTVFVEGTHLSGTSTSDQTNACESAAAATGATMRSVLARMAETGGASVLAAIALEFVGDGSQPAAPPTWTTQPNPTPPAPRTAPPSVPDGIWRITKAARKMASANQVDQVTAAVAEAQCLKLVTLVFAAADPYEACASEPIFLSGQADVDEATNHDLDALANYPAWVALNRRLNPGPSSWKDSDPICLAKLEGQNCDEFPFLSTQQGGGSAVPRPSLKAIDGAKNQLQGTRLGQFYSVCGVVEDGQPFLAIPVPPTAPTVSTLAICNP